MKVAVVLAALGSAVFASAQCQKSYNGVFVYQYQNFTKSKRHMEGSLIETRQVSCDTGSPTRLTNGRLSDSKGRTGYIVGANSQLQFDGPPQACPESVDDFCIQGNYLAIDGDTTFYNCRSGRAPEKGGDFYNIYSGGNDVPKQKNCFPVHVQIYPCIPSSPVPTAAYNDVPPPSYASCSAKPQPYGSVSFTASSSASTSASSSASTTESTSETSSSSSLVETSSAASVTIASPTPYPVSNSTTPAATGTGVVPPVTSSVGGATSVVPPPSGFTGAANVVAVGQKVVGLFAGLAAFAMF